MRCSRPKCLALAAFLTRPTGRPRLEVQQARGQQATHVARPRPSICPPTTLCSRGLPQVRARTPRSRDMTKALAEAACLQQNVQVYVTTPESIASSTKVSLEKNCFMTFENVSLKPSKNICTSCNPTEPCCHAPRWAS